MKRRMAVAAFALLLMSIFTACGSRMKEENTVTPVPTATTVPKVSAAPSATPRPEATEKPTAEDGVVTDENGILGDESDPNEDRQNSAVGDIIEDAENGIDRTEDKIEEGINDAAGVVR